MLNSPCTNPPIPNEEYDPSNEGRGKRLLSTSGYNYIRKCQLEYHMKHKKRLVGFFDKAHHPIEHSVLIGEFDEPIAIYETKPIGRGAYGKVCAGVSLDTGELVAVKTQRQLHHRDEHEFVADNEGRILHKLGRLIDHAELDHHGPETTWYQVQPFAKGVLLNQYLYKKEGDELVKQRHGTRARITVALNLLKEVQALHQQGVLHKDLKPSNILICESTKEITLVDFGLAGLCIHGEQKNQEINGTEGYMAPEIFHCEEKATYNEKTEVFALGVILAELFSSRARPYHPRAATMDIFRNTHEQGLLDIHLEGYDDLFKNVDIRSFKFELSKLIGSMIDIEPDNRPSIEEAIQSLETLYLQACQRRHRRPDKEHQPRTSPAKLFRPTRRCHILNQFEYTYRSEPTPDMEHSPSPERVSLSR